MSAPKNPRITLDPGAYHVLCIQAAIEQTSPGSLASRVILSYSQDAKHALQATGREAPSMTEAQAPKEISFQDPTMGESQTPPVDQAGDLPALWGRPPKESIRPAAGWIGPDGQRANGPVEARPEAHSGGAGG